MCQGTQDAEAISQTRTHAHACTHTRTHARTHTNAIKIAMKTGVGLSEHKCVHIGDHTHTSLYILPIRLFHHYFIDIS